MYITRTQEPGDEDVKYGLGVFKIEDEGKMNDLLQKLILEENIVPKRKKPWLSGCRCIGAATWVTGGDNGM